MSTDHSSTSEGLDPLSIVMPARNAATTIGLQLAALAQQDYAGAIEVVVVDNDSDDGTADIASSFRDQLAGLASSQPAAEGALLTRNVGFASASNEAILVCDADDVVDEHWASHLAQALKNSDVVGGGVINWTGGALPVGKPHTFVTGFGFLPSFGGCNFGTRRRVWDAIGGFDEELRSGEDFDFAWRAQLAGYTYSVHPTAVVYYRIDADPKAAFRRWRHYGTYEPALYAKFRSHGLARQPLHRAAAKWLLLAATSYRLVTGTNAARLKWRREAGRRIGRLEGSVRSRTLFL